MRGEFIANANEQQFRLIKNWFESRVLNNYLEFCYLFHTILNTTRHTIREKQIFNNADFKISIYDYFKNK